MKKSLLLFAIFVLVSVLFCSCKPSDAENENKPQNVVTDMGFFARGKQFYFVKGEGVTLSNQIDDVYEYVYIATRNQPSIITTKDEGGECEIVIGKSNRVISKEAYLMLERCYTGVSNESVWLIYVKDNSVCVAFDTNLAMRSAIAYLNENLLNEDFGAKKGVVAYESFDTIEKAREERVEKQTESIEALRMKIGDEAVEALKNLYGLYDEKLYIWLANLWCPDVGGFYYSNSGRNTEGFLPDIESTKQVLGFITGSGMVDEYEGGNYQTALLQDYPEIAEKILNFAVSLQAEDGYFYHPQWKDAPSTSRLGRDLNSARGIITKLGGTANYPYPEDNLGSSDDDEIVSVSALTGRLSNSSVLAVSKVVATAAPAYLQDLGKWAAYIESLGIDKGNSYSAGNDLVSNKKMIKAAGQEYCDYLINYLNDKQKDNGTWESEISYGALDGLMKISGLYEYFGVPLPRAKEAAQSCITRTIDTTPKATGKTHVCDVYNTWYALAAIIRMTETNPTVRIEIRQCVNDNLAQMIDSTRQKISIYRKYDGSFSWYEDESHYTSQGSVVAVPSTNEGDVNSSTIASAELLRWVFKCMDVRAVPMYYASDFDIFMDTICGLGDIIKDEAPDPCEITFDDVEISSDQIENGIVSSPDDMVDIEVRDKDVDGGVYQWLSSDVVASPDPRLKGDKALRFEVITKPCTCADDPCTCKKSAEKASVLYAQTQNGSILGNAYVAEFDFYLDEWGSNNIITQMGFSESYVGGYSMMFNLRTYEGSDGKNYLRLEDYYAGLDGVTNICLVDGIPAKEWVRFRFELYKTEQLITDDKSGEVKQYKANVCKIYVNGEYVSESDAAIIKDGVTSDKHVNGFAIQGYRLVPSAFYVDNVLVYRTNIDFVSEEEPGNGVLDNIAVDKTQTVATFENDKTVTYYLKNTILPGYIKYTVEEIAGKKALHVDKFAVHPTSQTDTQAGLSNPADDGECYTYETKIYYDSANMVNGKHVSQLSVNAASTLSFISLNFKYNGGKIEVLHNKNYLNGSDIKSTGAVVGIDGKALTLPVDEWFTFKLEFYRAETPSESMVKIYTGDANGENMALCAEFNGYMTAKVRDIERFLFTHYRATENISVYLDDISFTRSNKEFVSELPDVPVTPPVTPPQTPDTPTEHSPIESFDDLTTLKGDGSDSAISFGTENFIYSNGGSVVSGDEIKIVKDPTGEDNNVLMFKDGSESSYSSIWISVNSKNGKAKNGISVFETKLYVPKSEILTTGALSQPQYTNSSGTRLHYENLVVSSDKSYLYFKLDNAEGAETEGNITTDAWHTLRLEFYNYADGAGSPIIKVYVDGLYAGYTEVTTVKDTTGFRWAGVSYAKYTVYFDDMSLTEKAMPTE